MSESSLEEDNSFTPTTLATGKDTVQFMAELDHDYMQKLRDYNPALLGNVHQIYGYLPNRPKDIKRVILQQKRLAILGRMSRGRNTLRKFYDSEMTEYVANREVFRSIDGYERDSVNKTSNVQYNLTQPAKHGTLDRFLMRLGRNKQGT